MVQRARRSKLALWLKTPISLAFDTLGWILQSS